MITEEQYKQSREMLEKENIAQFPSVFQQARNLMKQVWLSGSDAIKGKPIIASAEKANARLQICENCEFYKDTRCIKCGCFMHKKVHIESADCPVNKWGSELQRMHDQDTLLRNLSKDAQSKHVDLKSMYPNDADNIEQIILDALQYDGRFSYNGTQYVARRTENGKYIVDEFAPKKSIIPLDTGVTSPEEAKAFNELVVKHQAPDQPKVFVFKNQYFYLVNRQKGGFFIYKVDPNNPPTGITLPPLE